ncbi:Beta-galactosidase [Deinococcus reticulitermitis]|uniref:beta-galactosidase n=1 Tax=Deinococcus reticulitermitis TaxID=856736 RepID=A0A1H7CVY5_9DEIO|nr:beta-galactosidase trimerization domain-containing protein [Deinococcus reticulitermitis]SEJ90900.1 Beta-galactosidase [Deinococcus reticulitermitis]
MEETLKTRYARTGHPDLTAFNHDLYRGLMQGQGGVGRQGPGTPNGLWVMEQQAGQVNWAPYNPLPADGAAQLWTAQAWAHGADVVSYFPWRAATMSQEILHSGLLRHDETPDRGHAEIAELETSQFPVGAIPARVALLHDYESLWLYDAQPQNAALSYWAQTLPYYSALRSLGVDVDVVSAKADLGGYDLIVAPAITLVTPELAQRWTAAVQGGARLVCGPRSAFRPSSGATWQDGQFGPLSSLVGARLLHYDSLRPGLDQQISGGYAAQLWAESYRLHGAQATHTYQGGSLDGQPAAIRQGDVSVLSAHSGALIHDVLRGALEEIGLPAADLPEGVRSQSRKSPAPELERPARDLAGAYAATGGLRNL